MRGQRLRDTPPLSLPLTIDGDRITGLHVLADLERLDGIMHIVQVRSPLQGLHKIKVGISRLGHVMPRSGRGLR
jgi:hypothetical protein